MATFIRLSDFKLRNKKEREFFNKANRYIVEQQDVFFEIPGNPIAYWLNKKEIECFKEGVMLEKHIDITGSQHITADNDRFLRHLWEINKNNVGKGRRWVFYNKGGEYKKWYGNIELVVDWSENAINFYKSNKTSNLLQEKYRFKNGLTWTATTSKNFNCRYLPNVCIFDKKGPSAFPANLDNLFYFISFLNTIIADKLLACLSTTMDYQNIDIQRLPIIFPESEETKIRIDSLSQFCINISKEEWDSRETSWNFTTNELLRHKTTTRIEDAYNICCDYWKDQFFKLHANEEELNRIFIDIYDLADELTPDVPLENISILKTESEIKDGELVFKKEILVKQFISYAVGCMFGRYSPDKPGLILANQGETIDDFKEKVPKASFMPDEDNIIPILEHEYFTDDIVSRFREFLKTTFGAESLAENLEFIAGALSRSKKGESPEKVIRDYFLKSFFKDHVKMYKKRPIYWLFTSGKGRGFNALVYMHRFNKETLAKMRTDYLLKLEDKLDARMGMLSSESNKDAQEMSRLSKLIDELTDYDAVLNNKALEFIDIDLDDGVTVNYAKFEGLVGKI
ncbi:MAG: BREX-1 system adenine-specific DNA-methyltransferase PglX [Methanosarcinales archaeon]|nr:BREX-1 system adenine-specific DNA-methyltransferase PglX [Methanosarcinales archaeon]